MTGLIGQNKAGYIPQEKKVEVATLFAVTGNVEKTAELAKIPVTTVKYWRGQQWFKDLLDEIRNENDDKLDAKFTEIVEKGLEKILDRIENGDYGYDTKTGDIYRKPVSMKDLAVVAAITVDKRQLLRGKPTSRNETVTETNRLAQLETAFLALAQKKPKELDVTPLEADFEEVLDEGEPKPTP
jgi:hypothetical protein